MQGTSEGFKQRLKTFRSSLSARQLNGFLVTAQANGRYLTGFTGSDGLCFVTPAAAFFVTDFRYMEQAAKEVASFFDLLFAHQSLFQPLAEKKLLPPLAKIGFEAAHLSYAQFQKLKEWFPETDFVPTEKILEEQAMRKEEAEIALLRQAARMADRALEEVLPLIKPGKKEREIAAELTYRMRLLGSEKDAFEPIVASGIRSALPHGLASDKIIGHNEFVMLDFGAVFHGYTSDMTRTIVVGKASPEMKKMYKTVREAQAKAIEAARPGMSCHELDQVAREHIGKAGYGQFFLHSLGHGLGLQVHSEPRVGSGSEVVLEENMVITIEPGIYIPEVGGVRIEDDIVIRKDGAECLTHFTRELIEIG